MAVDLKIEVFAYNLFQKFWFEHDLSKEIVSCCKVYKEDHHFPYEETLITYQAVLCRQVMYRTLYRKLAQEGLSVYRDSVSDFSNYIRSIFRAPMFTRKDIFDHLLATCAFVFEVNLHFAVSSVEFFSEHAHLCWAMYFDSHKKEEFYANGGWEAFFFSCLTSMPIFHMFRSCVFERVWDSDEGVSITEIVSSIDAFGDFLEGESKTDLEYSCSSVGMRWVRHHIEQRHKRWKKNSIESQNDEDTSQRQYHEDIQLNYCLFESILEVLRYLCQIPLPTICLSELKKITKFSDFIEFPVEVSPNPAECANEKQAKSIQENVVRSFVSAEHDHVKNETQTRTVIKEFVEKFILYHIEVVNISDVDEEQIFLERDSTTDTEELQNEMQKLMAHLYHTKCTYDEFSRILREVFVKEWHAANLSKKILVVGSLHEDQGYELSKTSLKACQKVIALVNMGNMILQKMGEELASLLMCTGDVINNGSEIIMNETQVVKVLASGKHRKLERLFQLCLAKSRECNAATAKLKLQFPKSSRPDEIKVIVDCASAFLSAVKEANNGTLSVKEINENSINEPVSFANEIAQASKGHDFYTTNENVQLWNENASTLTGKEYALNEVSFTTNENQHTLEDVCSTIENSLVLNGDVSTTTETEQALNGEISITTENAHAMNEDRSVTTKNHLTLNEDVSITASTTHSILGRDNLVEKELQLPTQSSKNTSKNKKRRKPMKTTILERPFSKGNAILEERRNLPQKDLERSCSKTAMKIYPPSIPSPYSRLRNPDEPLELSLQNSRSASPVEQISLAQVTTESAAKKKKKRKIPRKKDIDSTATKSEGALKDSPQQPLRKDFDKDLPTILRMILVLGDPGGIEFVKSTL